MNIKKKHYYKLSENAEKMGGQLMNLEKKYEKGKTTLKEIEKNSKSFAELKMSVELVREQYKTSVVNPFIFMESQ
jgi:phage shock protein A